MNSTYAASPRWVYSIPCNLKRSVPRDTRLCCQMGYAKRQPICCLAHHAPTLPSIHWESSQSPQRWIERSWASDVNHQPRSIPQASSRSHNLRRRILNRDVYPHQSRHRNNSLRPWGRRFLGSLLEMWLRWWEACSCRIRKCLSRWRRRCLSGIFGRGFRSWVWCGRSTGGLMLVLCEGLCWQMKWGQWALRTAQSSDSRIEKRIMPAQRNYQRTCEMLERKPSFAFGARSIGGTFMIRNFRAPDS